MVIIRRLCNESTSLQRQGQLALWAPIQGQEAAQIGAGRALAPMDFTFPTYREHGIAWCRGVPPENMLRLFRAVSNGGWDPQKYRHSVPTVVLGSQTLHAVGYAMGIQRDGAEEAAMAFFGDGASSQGDVLEAFVWAASFNAPGRVLPVRTTSGASRRRRRCSPRFRSITARTASASRACASTATTCSRSTRSPKRALDSARVGGGPTLIEAYTYRMGAHTTSDDPTRYRIDAEVEVWKHRDPVERVKALLVHEYKVKNRTSTKVAAEAETMALKLREDVLVHDRPDPITMFDNAYAAPHPLIEEGRREMIDLGISGGSSDGHATMTMAKALNEGLRRAMEKNKKVLLDGRGHRQARRRLSHHRRTAEGLRRGPRHRLAAGRVGDRRHRGRPRDPRLPRGGEIQFDGFVYPAFDQIVSQVAKLHKRSDGAYNMAWSSASPSRAASGRSSTTPRAPSRTSPRPPACVSCRARRRTTRTG
jgi:2-oxoisovalerate dehydrogenase E1 component alpha subunit